MSEGLSCRRIWACPRLDGRDKPAAQLSHLCLTRDQCVGNVRITEHFSVEYDPVLGYFVHVDISLGNACIVAGQNAHEF